MKCENCGHELSVTVELYGPSGIIYEWNTIEINPKDDKWILLLKEDGNFSTYITDKDDYSLREINEINATRNVFKYKENQKAAITHWKYIDYPKI